MPYTVKQNPFKEARTKLTMKLERRLHEKDPSFRLNAMTSVPWRHPSSRMASQGACYIMTEGVYCKVGATTPSTSTPPTGCFKL